MLLNRISLCFLSGMFCVTVYGLFYIKDRVTTFRTELVKVKKQIECEQDSMHVLKAELAYLISPERLQTLAKTYLDLKITETSQMSKDPLFEKQGKETKTNMASSEIRTGTLKWRYKRGPSKYVTKVSHTKLLSK
jgi:cell division protein FtsL